MKEMLSKVTPSVFIIIIIIITSRMVGKEDTAHSFPLIIAKGFLEI